MSNDKRGRGAVATSVRVLLATAMIGAFIGLVAPTAAFAVDPDHVTEGMVICTGGVETSHYIANPSFDPNVPGSTPFVCADTKADYSGNAGGGWNELDLVPFRLTESAGNAAPATQTYTIGVALDAMDQGHPGFDFLTVPTLLASESDASCVLSSGPMLQKTPGFGGTDVTIYRLLTITQARNSTCTIDFDGRLAVGSHLYPGSSLHGNTTDQAVSKTNIDRSIPVNEIQPQSISKDMHATQNTTHVWNLTKGAEPLNLNLGNTCDVTGGDVQGSVAVTISWTKGPSVPSGQTSITANIYATNPAHRTITVNVTDLVYEGATQTTQIHTANSGDVDVPANTTNFLVMTDTFLTSSTATTFNDVATATYTDKLTGILVPGTTTATASTTVAAGTESNDSATITDSESITGTGLEFSVATPSVGSFVNAGNGLYVAGTHTTGPVDWSANVTDGGSVTFNKTVYFNGPGDASGTLSDTAHLNNDTQSLSASASTTISSTTIATLTLTKTISVPADSNLAFKFDVFDSTDTKVGSVTVNIAQGQTSGTGTLSGLDDGSYNIEETDSQGFAEPNPSGYDGSFVVAAGSCTATATINNTFGPASARVKKVTDPAGHEAGWTFDLFLDNAPAGPGPEDTLIDTKTTTGTGFISFGTVVDEGDYYVVEHEQAGWTSNGGGPGCTFTVDYPADADATFSCTFTNTSRGHVDVSKTEDGATSTDTFDFELRQGVDISTNPDTAGTLLETQTVTADATAVDFTTDLIPGQTYTLCEIVMPGWLTSLPNQYTLVIAGSNERICTDFVAEFGDTTHFVIDNTSPPGGEQRTIGFWKNWTSCDGKGHQDPVLDETLALFPIASGQTTHGVFVGLRYVDTCTEAVRILSKQSIDGTRHAGNAMYGLAAQYLAAKLNVQAGASVCPSITTALSQAQTLLLAYGFNDVKFSAPSAAQKTQANALASLLDQYNNGLIC